MNKILVLIILLSFSGIDLQAQQPVLKKKGDATQLYVDGKPMLMLAGELGNSSSSSEAYLKDVWPGLKALNYNTILAAVTWEMIEPEEGVFDFSSVDHLIRSARQYDLKLVLLWFASWKNAASTYIPLWVKKDYHRFPRAEDASGKPVEILSAVSEENMKADARAFRSLMKHIAQVDKTEHTVLMMQIENEPGILNTPRDYSPEAEALFNGPIPEDLTQYLKQNKNNLSRDLAKVWSANGSKTKGTWEEVFGKSKIGGWSHTGEFDWHDMYYYTEELFMGYYYARYMGYVAAEGKKEYDIPMYANAWLKGPDYGWSGMHPGGGPLPSVMDMYRCGGPAIDILSPDIYVPHFTEIVEWYDQLGNPLFIPETRGGELGVSRLLWCLGEHNLMGFSPFGIDRSARTGLAGAQADPLAQAYKLIDGMQDIILEYQGTNKIRGFFVDNDNPEQSFVLGEYIVTADLMRPRTYASMGAPAPAGVRNVPETASGGGFIILLPGGEYMVMARNVNVRFAPAQPGNLPYIGLGTLSEGVFENGEWIQGRVLNGDQIHGSIFTGTGLKMNTLGIQRVTLYRYGNRDIKRR
ncbi:MAG: DUF5597 domain-containing protein [Bacteroidales bacterium]|nr:DUF5597 domain-containing protein [Bacteroidales bacterium]MDD4031233.1 DUF5597 domain-containing protein [Bacteroidales bacterium]MDD4435757.1 DUF5597 domain-containing protein [Bacteroidales bacterium]